jgi:hypothetical protein
MPDAAVKPRPGQSATNWHRLARDWVGETVFIVCGGTSLNGFDFERLRGRRVLVCNSSYLKVPWADALVFIDPRWYDDRYNPGIGHKHRPEFWRFAGERICLAKGIYDDGLLPMQRIAHHGLSLDPTRVMFGTTIVCSAINISVLRGAARGVLLGFDGKPGRDGKLWHHEPHPSEWPRIPGCFINHGVDMLKLKPQLDEIGFEVINANPESRHRMFTFASIDEILA